MKGSDVWLVLVLAGCRPGLNGDGRAWLRDHAHRFDQAALAVLDDRIEQDTTVLIGEFHGLDESYDVSETVVRWLYDTHGLGAVAEETGPGFAWHVTQASGDFGAMDAMHRQASGTFTGTEAARDLALALADVMDDPDVLWTGADIDHLWRPALTALAAHLCPPPIAGLPADLQDLADQLESGEEPAYADAIAVIQAIADDWPVQAAAFCPPERALDITSALVARDMTYTAWNAGDQHGGDAIREAFIREAFESAHAASGGPVVGRWGSWHVTRAPSDDVVDPVAVRLRDAGWPVLCIALAYSDSQSLDPTTGAPREVDDLAGDLLDPFGLGPITLFVLDGPDSPFAERPLLQDDRDGPPTTELYQAVILIREGTASTPL